ncbi:UbiA family prenyltransferase [Natronolimnohabitans sp. A-GB9]|nr:UbiA family prenyltransferase [Natronolimnohabitans sp. A-GB9]MDQ2050234.1 UbiA family prenyltransferase [Natronolimnohabitans sp. A-GB9]
MLPITLAWVALTGVGIVVAMKPIGPGGMEWSNLVGVIIAMTLAHWGQWFINDITDKEIDKESNADRATTQGLISEREAIAVGVTLMGFAVAYGATVNYLGFLSTLAWVLAAMVYTVPPIRLKNGAISSLLCFGIGGFLSVILGSAAVGTSLSADAWQIATVLALVIILTISYQDLKDAEHDAKAGVDNLVVRYGKDRLTRILVVALPSTFVLTPILFGVYYVVPFFAVLGGFGSYILWSWDGGEATDRAVTVINAVFFVSFAVAFYLS